MGKTLICDAKTGITVIADVPDIHEDMVSETDLKAEIIAEINAATTNAQLRAAMLKLAELV